MSLAIFPGFLSVSGHGLTFTYMRTPQMSTTTQDAPNGLQVRVQNYQNPKWLWTLIFDYLKNNQSTSPFVYTDLQTLLGFFNAQYGMGTSFLYNDSQFNSIGPGITSGSTPNPYAQLQIVNDGDGHYYAPIQIHYGGQSGTDSTYGFWEDVTDLQPTGGNDHSAFYLYDNGALKTYGTDYTIGGPGLAIPGASFMGLYAAFTYTPTGPITITCNFFYRVTFATDEQDFEQWMQFLWTIGGSGAKNGSGMLKLQTAWPPSV